MFFGDRALPLSQGLDDPPPPLISGSGSGTAFKQRRVQTDAFPRRGNTTCVNTEKSLRHVAMVAKFLGDNKPKTSLKK